MVALQRSIKLIPLHNSLEMAEKIKIIGNQIVQIAPLNANLCALQAVFNAIRTVEVREAVAAGNLESPAQSFIFYVHGGLNNWSEKVQIGYNATDFN